VKKTAFGVLASVALLVAGSAGVPSAQAAPDLGKRGAAYVSLGDSYVAAGDNVNGVNVTPGCQQAPDNVGHLVAARLKVSFADWSCSGADTDDITKNTEMGPQVNGLGPATKYVSLSIGGNDEGIFGDYVAACIIDARCTDAMRRQTLAKIDRLGPKLDSTYAAVRAAAPNAEVVVMRYLQIVPRDPSGCFLGVSMGKAGAAFANRVQDSLNATISASAKKIGFTVVNSNQKPGRDMCAPDGRRYVSLTGLGPQDHGTPVHPTIAGRKYSAALIAAAFQD